MIKIGRENHLFQREVKYTLLFCLVYFTSYITRTNYGAALIDVSQTLGISNSLAGIPISLSFITYGFGQLIAGYLGDKINSVKIVTVGLLLTISMNFSVALSNNIYLIMVFWAINGFAQSLLWPPLVKIMLSVFNVEQYKKSCSLVVMSSAFATVLIYIFVPLCISYFDYRLVFVSSALFGIAATAVWIFFTKNLDLTQHKTEVKHSEKISIWRMIITCNLIPIMVIITLQGMLREGVTLWMPAFVNDIFNQSTENSIFMTILLPIFSIVVIAVTRFISKKIHNEIMLSGGFWLVSLISCVVLLIGMTNMAISLVALTTLTSCMHAINLLLIGNLPAKFVKYNNISTISGVLNSCTYIGSTIATYAIAEIAEVVGWTGNITFWIFVTLSGLILCLFNLNYFKRHLK